MYCSSNFVLVYVFQSAKVRLLEAVNLRIFNLAVGIYKAKAQVLTQITSNAQQNGAKNPSLFFASQTVPQDCHNFAQVCTIVSRHYG